LNNPNQQTGLQQPSSFLATKLQALIGQKVQYWDAQPANPAAQQQQANQGQQIPFAATIINAHTMHTVTLQVTDRAGVHEVYDSVPLYIQGNPMPQIGQKPFCTLVLPTDQLLQQEYGIQVGPGTQSPDREQAGTQQSGYAKDRAAT
jgi:hypothetical protein